MSRVVHPVYSLKSDRMGLPDYYQVAKPTKDRINVGYGVIVAEFVNKWL